MLVPGFKQSLGCRILLRENRGCAAVSAKLLRAVRCDVAKRNFTADRCRLVNRWMDGTRKEVSSEQVRQCGDLAAQMAGVEPSSNSMP
jgi:hypothetical protein